MVSFGYTLRDDLLIICKDCTRAVWNNPLKTAECRSFQAYHTKSVHQQLHFQCSGSKLLVSQFNQMCGCQGKGFMLSVYTVTFFVIG